MKRFWAVGALALLLVGGSLLGQLSQSGGSGGTVTFVAKTTCGTTSFDSGVVSMPTSSTVVTATATCVDAVLFINRTALTQTITLTDNQGSPVAYLQAFNVPANSTLVYDLHFAKFANGIKWQATNATSVNAQIVGLQ